MHGFIKSRCVWVCSFLLCCIYPMVNTVKYTRIKICRESSTIRECLILVIVFIMKNVIINTSEVKIFFRKSSGLTSTACRTGTATRWEMRRFRTSTTSRKRRRDRRSRRNGYRISGKKRRSTQCRGK